jgi:hypothetical protein
MTRLQYDLIDLHIKPMFIDRFGSWPGLDHAMYIYRTHSVFNTEVNTRVNEILRLVDIHINGVNNDPVYVGK